MNSPANNNLLGKLVGFVVIALTLMLGLMFSAVLLVVALLMGLVAFGYFWWKTRSLRKEILARAPGVEPDGQVFEGESVRIDERE